MNEIVEDPVCHMKVPTTSYPAEYAGTHYAFCSEQCRERFLAKPRVYVGYPGKKAPGQQGKVIVKRRRLLLSEPLDEAQAGMVRQALLEMMGMHDVSIEGDKLEITYDLMQATTGQIAEKLSSIGARLGGGWMERLKLAFTNYQEEVEISSLQVNNRKCCH